MDLAVAPDAVIVAKRAWLRDGYGTMRLLIAAAIAGLTAVPSFASAELPATIRGVVYSCDTGAPIANASVWIKELGQGTPMPLVTDGRGGFARVGLTPGRYLVMVAGPVRGSSSLTVRGASRLARVETDDVLDVRLGTQTLPPTMPSPPLEVIAHAHVAPFVREPVPICDAAVVPPAPSTSDRYIIR